MRVLASAVRDAVTGGRFLNAWSMVATIPLSLTIMAPVGAGVDVSALFPATLATTASFVGALAMLGVTERRIQHRPSRAVLVIVGVVLCAALRPVVQDGWAAALGLPSPSSAQLPFRVATNVIVWPVVLAVVAVLENALRTLRRTNALLREVVHEVEGMGDRARSTERRASAQVDAAASALAVAVARLGEPAGAGTVGALGATGFRTWSHRLAEIADHQAQSPRTAATEVPLSAHPPRRPGPRLPFRLPPRAAITLVYIACTLPYALRTSTATDLLAGIAVVVVSGTAVDTIARSRRFARTARSRATAFLVASAVAGVLMSVFAFVTGHHGVIAVLPALDFFGFSIAGGLCAGVLHALRRDQRRLSGAIAHAQQVAREGTRSAREGLRRVAEVLHRDGQGACVHFSLTHPAPTTEDLAALRGSLGELVDRLPSIYADADGGADAAALAALTATWGRIIDLGGTVTPAAHDALDAHASMARDVYEVAAEGLLNAVKHSGERRADIDVDIVPTGAGPRLRVRVRSFGSLPAGTRLRPASHARELGAHLQPVPGGAVLEATFTLPATTGVVSTEHPGESTTRPS